MPRRDHPAPDRAPDDIAIVTLPPDRWEEYRDFRLIALRTDSIAFGETLARALAHPDALWRDRLADGDRLLRFAERDGRLVGLAAAIPDDDESDVALVVSVFVEPSARGWGVAWRLVGTLLEELAGRHDVLMARLFVNDTNAAATASTPRSGSPSSASSATASGTRAAPTTS